MLFNSPRLLLKLLNNNKLNLQFQHIARASQLPASIATKPPPKSYPIFAAVGDHNNVEINWTEEIQKLKADEPSSLIEPIENDTMDVANTAHPNAQPSFNLAAYVSKSATLQQLIHLGVDLHRIEKKPGVPEFILKLDFETGIQPYLAFFHELGIVPDDFGWMITRNPLIFTQKLPDLETRINYLQSKTFKRQDIARICERNPFWLMFETQRIDRRLGYFQSTFSLAGREVRYLATKQAKLITYGLEAIRQSTFSIREEMGFDETETKNLLLSVPRIWMMNRDELLRRFDYIHRTMGISHQHLVQQPELMYCRTFRIQERHEFLKSLNRAQYDSSLDMYVSLKALVEGSDTEFVINVAKSTHRAFNEFLRRK